MKYVDPTTLRLSDNLLLSDFMGSSSIYKRGLANVLNKDCQEFKTILRNGKLLANTLTELGADLGAFSICYGFISPSVSRKTVRWRDPHAPSYHRWDAGAAADVCFHDEYRKGASPVLLAGNIDQKVPYSRMITYSESEWICFGVNAEEKTPRRAFYENRYIVEESKPQHVKYGVNGRVSKVQKAHETVNEDWRGQGWPRYHLYGKKGYEHVRVSAYTTTIDFLYSRDLVHDGVPNRIPIGPKRDMWMKSAEQAGTVVDVLVKAFQTRVSITGGYRNFDKDTNWLNRMTLEVTPPVGVLADEMAEIVTKLAEVRKAEVIHRGGMDRLRVYGESR